MIGGDPHNGYFVSSIWIEDVAYDDDEVVHTKHIDIPDVVLNNEVLNVEETVEVVNAPMPFDEFHNVHRQVMEALDRGNELHREEVIDDAMQDNEDVGIDTLDGLEELYE